MLARGHDVVLEAQVVEELQRFDRLGVHHSALGVLRLVEDVPAVRVDPGEQVVEVVGMDQAEAILTALLARRGGKAGGGVLQIGPGPGGVRWLEAGGREGVAVVEEDEVIQEAG